MEEQEVDQEKILDDALLIVKSQGYQMKVAIENNKLRNSLKFAKQPVTIISESADEFSCTSAIVLIERFFFPNAQVIIIIISAIV